MSDNAFGDFFVGEVDDEMFEDDDEILDAPVVVVQPAEQAAGSTVSPMQSAVPPSIAADMSVPAEPQGTTAPASMAASPTPLPGTREQRLADALDGLMQESPEIQAAALVSLDGFTMASALPETMQEDRVGAMSAAILGLGERAAAELGKGALSQVFIEGEDGYVMLIAAGDRAVLTCLADMDAKLGLVLYDMRTAADTIAEILG